MNPQEDDDLTKGRWYLEIMNGGTNVNLNSKISDDAGATRQAAAALRSPKCAVEQLDLGHNNIGDAGARAIADALRVNTILRKLDLGHNNIGAKGAEFMTDALRVNMTLRRLGLSSNNIGDGAGTIADGLRLNVAILELDLGENNIGVRGAQGIALALRINAELLELDLYNNNIGDDGAQSIADSLRANSSLQVLSLHQNNIGVRGARAIVDALQVNRSLQSIYLAQNNFGDDGVLAIADVLRVNTKILELGLGRNSIGVRGAQAIADALLVNTSLQGLFLGMNNIGDDGAQAIAEALQVNTKLRELSLRQNSVGDHGVQGISNALRVNSSLQILYLDQNNIRDHGAQAIADALRVNTTLEELDLDNNEVCDSVMRDTKAILHNHELRRRKVSRDSLLVRDRTRKRQILSLAMSKATKLSSGPTIEKARMLDRLLNKHVPSVFADQEQHTAALREVVIISDKDILLDKGTHINEHPGNKQYRRLIESNLERYTNEVEAKKNLVAKEIVDSLTAEGCRFITMVDGDWEEVEKHHVYAKAQQLLRKLAVKKRDHVPHKSHDTHGMDYNLVESNDHDLWDDESDEGTSQPERNTLFWTPCSSIPNLFRRRSAMAAVRADGTDTIYFVGGEETGESKVSAEVGCLRWGDAGDGEWSDLPGLNVPRKCASSIVVGGKLYVFGGSNGERNLDSCEELDLNTPGAKWTLLAATLPSGLRDMTVVSYGKTVYLIGGQYNPPSDAFTKFDTESKSVQKGPPMKRQRAFAAAVAVSDKVHVVGGKDVEGNWQSSVQSFDMNTGQWRNEIPDMTAPERALGVFAADSNTLMVVTESGLKRYRFNEGVWDDHAAGDSRAISDGDSSATYGSQIFVAAAGTLVTTDPLKSSYTMMLQPDSGQTHVGQLSVEFISNPGKAYPMRTSGSPFIFLSHRGPDTKESIARPTHWFLKHALQHVDVFLDDESIPPTEAKARILLENAHRCTHALVILSPDFLGSEYCVQELNTFVVRHGNGGGFRLVLAPWQIDSLEGYSDAVKDVVYVKNATKTTSEAEYMVGTLWPYLAELLLPNRKKPPEAEMQKILQEYVKTHNTSRKIPSDLYQYVFTLSPPVLEPGNLE